MLSSFSGILIYRLFHLLTAGCFIFIDSEENGKTAIEALNGHSLHGNELYVQAAKSHEVTEQALVCGIVSIYIEGGIKVYICVCHIKTIC